MKSQSLDSQDNQIDPSAEWNCGCEAYYLGVPPAHNRYCDESKFTAKQRLDWVEGWNFAHESSTAG